LTSAIASSDFGSRYRGADFNFYTQNGPLAFADARMKTRYTIIASIQWGCNGCRTELADFSSDANLGGYCRAHSDICQVFGNLEDMDLETPATLQQIGDDTTAKFSAYHIQLPYIVETDADFLNGILSLKSYYGGFGRSEYFRQTGGNLHQPGYIV